MLTGVAALLGAIGASWAAEAQTLRMMKSLDAPHYDGQRTTGSPTSDIVNMVQDTLVALDWDGKTPIPYLAKSWTVSEDGRLYTFKLRDDVSFCSGKKFTAADVVYYTCTEQSEVITTASDLARRQSFPLEVVLLDDYSRMTTPEESLDGTSIASETFC